MPDPPHCEFDTELEDFTITADQVKKRLSGLKAGKAPGPDGITPYLLSELSDTLALPITRIFKKSLQEGKIPEDWRKARVTPIFKKVNRLSANNYRPVSLTCVLCKVMEALLREQIMEHLQCNSLICRE